MLIFKKGTRSLILLILGLLMVTLWVIGKYISTDWLSTYIVDLCGAVGFLILAFWGLSKANQKVGPREETEE